MVRLNNQIIYVWAIYLLAGVLATGGTLRLFSSSSATAVATVALGFGFIGGLGYVLLYYRSWNVLVQDGNLTIRRGVFRKKKTVVPRKQIQHIDVEARLVERAFGVSRLVVYTAGSPHSDLTIPGLDSNGVRRLREQLSRGSTDD